MFNSNWLNEQCTPVSCEQYRIREWYIPDSRYPLDCKCL